VGSTRFDGKWVLEEALGLVRSLVEPLKEAGFAIALTGSVLNKGESLHDLDIIIYPLQSTAKTDFENARGILINAGLRCHINAGTVRSVWRKKGSLDEKEVEVWQLNKRRVDVFFLK
jgi:hypothetical protein